MNKDILIAREAIAAPNFDPMNIDLGEIKELSMSIPTDGQIDINQCEILAAKSLRIADLCSEYLAIATCHASKCETNKKKCYSVAALSKASVAGIKTDKSRAWYGESDEDYIEACNKYSEALALVKWLTSKHDSAVRFHYLCKQMLTRNYTNERSAGFSADPDKMVEDANKTNNWAEEANKEDDEYAKETDEFGKGW